MSGSVIHYKGIAWEVNGTKDGKGVLTYQDCRIQWCDKMECFSFIHGEERVLCRVLRSDCIREATDCLLEAFASQFVPCWETPNGETQEAQV